MKTLHLTIILGIALIMMTGIFYLTTSFAGGDKPLTGSGPPNFQLSDIIASGKNVYVAYKTNMNPEEIFFRKSTNEGMTFDKIIKINDYYAHVSEPHMAVSGNNVYITWFNDLDVSSNILLKKSTDNGSSFGDAIVLDPNVAKGYSVIYEILAADSNVYMAMNDYNLSSSRVNHVFRTSTDNGDTFGKPVTITDGESLDTKITVSEPNIYVIWIWESICPPGVLEDCQKSNVFFTKSVDNGTTFTKTLNLSNGTLSIAPQIATSKNNVFVVWQEGQYPNIFFTKSSDNGSNFSNKINLSKKLGYSIDPLVAASGNNVYVIFYHNMYSSSDVKNSTHGIYLTKSSDGGNTFSDPIRLTNTTSSTYDMIAGKNLYMIWNDLNHASHKEDVFFAKIVDNGTIDNTIDLSNGISNNSSYGRIAVDGKNVYVEWLAESYDTIYFRASNDGGNTFGNVANLNHELTVPEFPLAQVVLVISIVSAISFFRIKFRK